MYSPLLLGTPAFIPAMGATGQHGWGGRSHHLFCLPMNVPGSSLSAWETEAINRQNAVKSGWG